MQKKLKFLVCFLSLSEISLLAMRRVFLANRIQSSFVRFANVTPGLLAQNSTVSWQVQEKKLLVARKEIEDSLKDLCRIHADLVAADENFAQLNDQDRKYALALEFEYLEHVRALQNIDLKILQLRKIVREG